MSRLNDLDFMANGICSNRVKQVFSGRIESSDQHIRVDLGDLAAGSYFYRVQTDEGVSQRKVVVY
jgi:hypothetical protein